MDQGGVACGRKGRGRYGRGERERDDTPCVHVDFIHVCLSFSSCPMRIEVKLKKSERSEALERVHTECSDIRGLGHGLVAFRLGVVSFTKLREILQSG